MEALISSMTVSGLAVNRPPHILLLMTRPLAPPRFAADARSASRPACRAPPAPDALQAKLGGGNFEVVAVNIDTRDPDKPRNWLRDVGITRLAYYADPSAKVFQDLKLVGRAFGMPTTLIVDPAGCEIGTVAGPAEWAGEDALKLVTAALGRP